MLNKSIKTRSGMPICRACVLSLWIAAFMISLSWPAFSCCDDPAPQVTRTTSPENPCPGDLITITTTTTYYRLVSCDPYTVVAYDQDVDTDTTVAGSEYAANCPPPQPCTNPEGCPPPCTNSDGCPPPDPDSDCQGGSGGGGGGGLGGWPFSDGFGRFPPTFPGLRS